ncbi:heterokaryon incompatibility protein-domain-containing protein [Lophiotrema nucula]|uniref:Heterokaryon incompatibility protein-domain-containing protein n=1 Tax=Lophiotrema nucula TaxID=690887 RepID=A0A6A5YMI0_9PLEO|nr:heterokaryon incompatibility protein-domain-containing protein [Lophiotrema nucula]
MATPYVYQPLTEKQQFRLLKVRPRAADTKDPQSTTDTGHTFELLTTTIEDAPRYETVSYVWGSGERDAKLVVNASAFLMLTQRLYASLKELSEQSVTGYLWIDQICIDQESNLDKSHQVPLMGDIYRSCVGVLIYLSTDLYLPRQRRQERESILPDTSRATNISIESSLKPYFDNETDALMCHKVATDLDRMQTTYQMLRSVLPEMDGLPRARRQLYSHTVFRKVEDAWVPFYLFFDHPWFERGWTFQEMALPPWAKFIMCGYVFTYQFLFRAGIQVAFLGRGRGAVSHEWKSLFKQKLPAYDRLIQCASKPAGPRNDAETMTEVTINIISSDSEFSVQADRMYAFFHFLDEEHRPTIDYCRPWQEVFSSVAVALSSQSNELVILRWLEREPIRKLLGHELLPSWVPNWSNRWYGHERGHSSDYHESFAADKSRKHYHTHNNNIYHLSVRGRIIDSIKSIFQGPTGMHQPPLSFVDFLKSIGEEYDKYINVLKPLKEEYAGFKNLLKRIREHYPNIIDDDGKRPCSFIADDYQRTGAIEEEFRAVRSRKLGERFISGRKGTRNGSCPEPPKSLRSAFFYVLWMLYTHNLLRMAKNPLPSGARLQHQVFKELMERYRHYDTLSMFVDSDHHLKEQWTDAFTWEQTPKHNSIASKLKTLLNNRNLFMSVSGRLGFTYMDVKEGDLLCIAHGSRDPVLLRPADAGMYKVVGCCFAQGVMYGEAVDWEEDQADEFLLC